MAARTTTIDFLPKEDWEKGALGKFLKWALSVGRHIVIFTELIVILAFLSRFKFDRDLTDLSEEIKQKQAIVTASADFETGFRFLSKRLETIAGFRQNQLEANQVLAGLSAITPLDVFLSDFSVEGKEFNLTATAITEAGLGTFIKNLKESPNFEKLAVMQVVSGGAREIGIKFQLKGGLISQKK